MEWFDDETIRRTSIYSEASTPRKPDAVEPPAPRISDVSLPCVGPPWVFLIWRMSAFIYVLVTMSIDISRNHFELSYFTHWSYLGLCVTLLMLCALTFYSIRKGHDPAYKLDASDAVPAARWYAAVYQIFMTAPFLVNLTYWMPMYTDRPLKHNIYDLSEHGVNVLITLVDMLFSRIEFTLNSVVYHLLYVLVYFGFSWIRFAFRRSFVYFFLDFRKENSPNHKPVGTVLGYYAAAIALVALSSYLPIFITWIKRMYRKEDDDDRLMSSSSPFGVSAASDV